ncbi:transglycosylase SLT domain-containing protein [Rhizobium sp. FKY42]|uniref:transglycosylase SLT domain-containing protein n=1 Tax=Rhizobium sp. FKY42 TaxID=2562310 RepID=UPI001FED6920|nr:transglycosylase SLT domain-containing protein [Rhizobium sp. FKY42]
MQTASNAPAKTEVAAAQPQVAQVSASPVNGQASPSGAHTSVTAMTTNSGAAQKGGRVGTDQMAALQQQGPVAVPVGMTTQVAEKGGRVHQIALPTGASAIKAQNDSVIASLAEKQQPFPAAAHPQALAVAPTSIDKNGGLQAINMATAERSASAPVSSPAALTASAQMAQVVPAALPPEMTAAYTAIPTPRPRLTTSTPSNMVAFAGPVRPGAGMAGDFFPPAPGAPIPPTAEASTPTLNALIRRYAGLYGVPESLVHRVVHRESKYDPRAYNKRGYWGLMQIKYSTAKSMGYAGTPDGLLDAETNLKYAIKYLRGAWLVSENDSDDAIKMYARGYYYDAKRKDMLDVIQ